MGVFKEFLRVWLKHQAFPRAKGVHVHHGMIVFREYLEAIVLVSFWRLVNVALRTLQSPEVTVYVLFLRLHTDQETDHKRRIDHFAEALLFEHIQGYPEDIGSRDLTVKQQR